jgi:sugar/nucleoside kinase (ribokinase family)
MPGAVETCHNRPLPTRAAATHFDVVCAGEALWHLIARGDTPSVDGASLGFRPGGGAVSAALAMAKLGLRVGLATSLADDSFGRALRRTIAAAGVDIGGVELTPPRTGLVVLDRAGGARPVVSYRDEEQPAVVPVGWQSQVLLLSGVSPVLANAATFCREARAARRAGTVVVLDVNARWHVWSGRDPRAVRMVLREADAVHFSTEDLTALGMEVTALRPLLRATAVLVVSDGAGGAWAAGPFGETRHAPPSAGPHPARHGEAIAASICRELARAGGAGETRGEVWQHALESARRVVRQ